jgi:hypothetical protein
MFVKLVVLLRAEGAKEDLAAGKLQQLEGELRL